MLKHPFIWKICLLTLAILLAIKIWVQPEISLIVVLIPLFIYLGIAAWGSMNVNSNFYTPVLWKGIGDIKSVAFTFDDGPSAVGTVEILEILKKYNIRAAFFCIGKNAELHPEVLQKIHDGGHLIGNHSYSHHAVFDLFPAQKVQDDLIKANASIEKVINKKPLLFRPPYGVTNPMLSTALQKLKLLSIGWSIRSLDTVIADKDKLFKRVTRNVKPGDIFLFHDKCKVTVQILPALIEYLIAEGYVIERVDKLLNIPAYA
jgi:peptidoglycan/xylan/chitin deacetylase (PgdA/CDA1 family)